MSSGGAFLLAASLPSDVLTPEDLTEDHRAIGRTIDEFWAQEIEPALPALFRHEPGVARRLLQRAATLGLTAMQIPEAWGGLALDLTSVMVAVEHLSDDASYSGWHLGHTGIGTLPLVFYGTEDQQRRYLPRLATAEMIAAYALTEAQAGSDALGIRTRADLSADGRHYLLTGQKMWITNGGEADLFTVFAKVGGDAFTAFLVERTSGVTSGAEEHKMGLTGTSTTAVYFDRVPVPVANVLGDIGQGHRIAFNILNTGRLKMGPLAIRGAKKVLKASAAYAAERRAFGAPIGHFGAVREMLADSAVRLFAIESATWRVVGLIEADAARRRAAGRPAPVAELEAFEEFAGECSIVKVASSEMLDAVADHGVQIHGGYGYHRDYLVERAYRDARINRIFEGTNEINRLLLPGLFLKRAARAGTALADAATAALTELAGSPSMPPAADDAAIVGRARALTLAMMGAAIARHGEDFRTEQEITLRVADAMIETFVIESCVARAARTGTTMATIYLHDALPRIVQAASEVFAATMDGAAARAATEAARAAGASVPVDVIGLRRALG